MRSDRGGETLSFVDVVTNGAAGLVLLFLMLAVDRVRITWGRAAAPAGAGASAPFVVLVTPADGQGPDGPLLPAGTRWSFGAGPALAEEVAGGHALLVLPGPPPAGATLRLAPLPDGRRAAVEVYRDGRRALRRTVTATGGRLTVPW